MSLWLGRLLLDTRSRDVRCDLRDAAALHRRVMSLIPDGLGDQARRRAGLLYRVEETRTGIAILVQASMRPNPARLPERYGEFATRDLTPLIDTLQPGVQMHYRIAANTSKRVAKPKRDEKVGQVIPLAAGDVDAWWQRHATACGLDLITSFARPLPTAIGIREKDKRQHRVRHAVTRFDGLAVVRDSKLLREAIANGIGRGKSYGCGLLSLAPVRSAA